MQHSKASLLKNLSRFSGILNLMSSENSHLGIARVLKGDKSTILNLLIIILSLTPSLLAEAPDTLWTRTYGGSKDEYCYQVQQTSDGGFVLVGSTGSVGATIIPDVYVIRKDSNGDTLWTKTYDGDSADMGYSIQQTSDNGFIIARWKRTLHSTVEEYLAQYQRELRAAIENLREKYNQPLHEILKKRDEANDELAGYLKELGYES